jgi:hypothetical protein
MRDVSVQVYTCMRNPLLLETPKALPTKYLSKDKYGDDLTSIVKMVVMILCLYGQMKWTISRRQPNLAMVRVWLRFRD